MFVEPDLQQLKRWLFIPPHARNGVKEGDYLRCAILRHPIRDGKPQAKVLTIIGNATTPGIENLYSMAKYRLASEWSSACKQEVERLVEHCKPLQTSKRRDLTDLEFISIDTVKTQDIDDALYAEISNDGWTLFVAIADPTAYIEVDSELHRDIASRGAICVLSRRRATNDAGTAIAGYLCTVRGQRPPGPGGVRWLSATAVRWVNLNLSRLPCALAASCLTTGFERYLNGQADELMSHATPLEALYQVFRALRANREENGLVMEDRQEFRWILNDQKQIEHIEPFEKLLSQKLVEECMIAANRCAANFLRQQGATGPFVVHPGIRPNRLDEARKFLSMHAPEVAEKDPTTVEGYRDIMRCLARAGARAALANNDKSPADPRGPQHGAGAPHGYGTGNVYQLHFSAAQVCGFRGASADQVAATRATRQLVQP